MQGKCAMRKCHARDAAQQRSSKAKRFSGLQIDMKGTGANIGRLIGRKGISIRQLSEDLGLGSVQSVYRWLRGINMPTVDNLGYLAQYFGVSINEIVRYEKENENAGI